MSGSRSSCGIASWSDPFVAGFCVALVLAWAGVCGSGCSRQDAGGATAAPATTASGSSEPAVREIPPAEAGGEGAATTESASEAGDGTADRALALRAAYASAAPVSGKSVGHTSVVFKLKLEGGIDAAYKPRSTRGGRRYRGEVAAYRLARSLSLTNVPYAAIRAFDFATLEHAVGHEPIFAQVVKEPVDDAGAGGDVRGALIPWIKGLEFLPLEKDAEGVRWRAWLKSGETIPADQRAMAAQISTMVTFDYVTGNWDRWSGGNVGFDRARGEILFIDNDGAFFDPVPAKEMKRGADYFAGVERFSRSFVAALRAVDVQKALGEEVPGEPLLTARVVAQTEARRTKALAVIDAKIAKLGESAVLAFE